MTVRRCISKVLAHRLQCEQCWSWHTLANSIAKYAVRCPWERLITRHECRILLSRIKGGEQELL